VVPGSFRSMNLRSREKPSLVRVAAGREQPRMDFMG
jgi:hypothetical protein